MVSVSAVPSSVSRAAPLRRFLLSPLGQASVVAAIVFIAYLAVELTGWPNRNAAKVLDTVTFPALGFIYVPLAVVAAARARGRTRAAWVAMAIGFASWAAGEMITAVVKLAGHELPFPSWADAAYLLYVPWVLVALLLFPGAGNLRSQGRMTLDGVVVASSFSSSRGWPRCATYSEAEPNAAWTSLLPSPIRWATSWWSPSHSWFWSGRRPSCG